jgi:hypothetical protein
MKASDVNVLLIMVLLASSGCVAEDVEKDSATGQLLQEFGDFSSSNDTTSYELSLDSVTDSALMGPVSDAMNDFRSDVDSEEGVEMKDMSVEVESISSDRASVNVDYVIEDNQTGTMTQDVTLVFVRENGKWKLQDPLATNFNREMLDSPRR